MTDSIAGGASALVRRCGTRDPFSIAKQLGIYVLWENDFTNLKGMYRVIKRSRFIFISSNLDAQMQKIVCAHELGHDALHREFATDDTIPEIRLFGVDTRRELEANIFAAHLLIDSAKVVSLAKCGYTYEYIAAALKTNANLVAIIIDYLISQGYAFSPQHKKNNILR